jgi:hypothetical protein
MSLGIPAITIGSGRSGWASPLARRMDRCGAGSERPRHGRQPHYLAGRRQRRDRAALAALPGPFVAAAANMSQDKPSPSIPSRSCNVRAPSGAQRTHPIIPLRVAVLDWAAGSRTRRPFF